MTALLNLENVHKHYHRGFWHRQFARVLDGVSLRIEPATTLAVVGESGSGKTTLCRVALGLTFPTSGRVLFEGQDLSKKKGNWRQVRRRMQAVFQDADSALNPRLTVSDLLYEPARIHGINHDDRECWTANLLDMVNLSPDLLCRRPHELSGGQRQRVSIARAMSLSPRLVVADEPIASLDRSAQAQVLCLLQQLQNRTGVAYVVVSHDLRSVRFLAHRVAVMYLGVIVENACTEDIFRSPMHSYTRALLASVPGTRSRPAETVTASEPPSPFDVPGGCRFHPRCPDVRLICSHQVPPLRTLSDGRQVACFAV